jgi:hypothetical protein
MMVPLSRFVHRKPAFLLTQSRQRARSQKGDSLKKGASEFARVVECPDPSGCRFQFGVNEASANQPEIDSVSTDEGRANASEV